MTVTVVGLGKIGLPLAVQIAGHEVDVIGADVADAVVAAVNDGLPPFPGEAELDERLRAAVDRGQLRATTDTAAAVAVSNVVIVVVPLVVDAQAVPDFRAIDAATTAIAAGLQPGTLVSYETTLPVGTTRGRFTSALAAKSGLKPGSDLFVCHSPERVSSGTVFRDLARYPKLVGGIDDESAARGVRFYSSILDFDERDDLPRPNGVWDLGSAEAAELAKLAETTYRDVNIAFANELAITAERWGLDVGPVIAACNSQPYSHIHQPGISVGGHCIPVYPHFLLAGAPDARLPVVAREVNTSMPARCVERLAAVFDGDLSGRTIAVLGLAYRAGVKEHAFSGTFELRRVLEAHGAQVRVHDPLYSREELQGLGFEPLALGDSVDALILHTAHDEYLALGPADLPGVRTAIDGRGVLDPASWAGVQVITLGRPAAAANRPARSAARPRR